MALDAGRGCVSIADLCCILFWLFPKVRVGCLAGRATASLLSRYCNASSPRLRSTQIAAEADEIVAAAASEQKSSSGHFWTKRLRKPILLAILIAFFNQMSGINAILYFAPRIFELTGLGAKAALLQSIGIGITNLVFTFVGLWLIDRLGRRTLLYIGSVGYITSLGLVAWAFFTGHFSDRAGLHFRFHRRALRSARER